NQPDDPLLLWYQGELHSMREQYALADQAFTAGMMSKPDVATLEMFRDSRIVARFYTGQARTAYAEIGPPEETFLRLAGLCLAEGKLDDLQFLLDAHRKHD